MFRRTADQRKGNTVNKSKLLAFFLLLTGIAAVAGAQSLMLDKTVATVNLIKPERISLVQLNQQVTELETIRAQAGQAGAVDKAQVLDLIIADVLMAQAMERDKVRVTEEELNEAVAQQKSQVEKQNNVTLSDTQFRTAIEQQSGLSWEAYRDQIRQQVAQQKYLMQKKSAKLSAARVPPTSQEIDLFFRKNRNQFSNPEIIRFSHIFISTVQATAAQRQAAQQKAEDIYRKLQNGADFGQLVVENSDDTRSRYKEGDAGFLAINDTRPAAYFGQDFVDKVFSLQEGQVSGVLTSKQGFHIVKITEYHPARLLELSDKVSPDSQVSVREYIAQVLMAQKSQTVLKEALQELVDELKAQAEITIYRENIN